MEFDLFPLASIKILYKKPTNRKTTPQFEQINPLLTPDYESHVIQLILRNYSIEIRNGNTENTPGRRFDYLIDSRVDLEEGRGVISSLTIIELLSNEIYRKNNRNCM